MKKIIAIVLAAVMVLSLAACGNSGPKPEDTVKTFCESMKNFDIAAMQACLDKQFSEDELFGEGEEDYGGLVEFVKKSASELTYTVNKAEVNGDTAKVTADMQYTDISPVIKETFTAFFTKMIELMFSGASEEESDEAFEETLKEIIANGETSRADTTVTFDLKKVDKEWKITEMPEEAMVVLTGNMEKGIDDIDLGLDGDDMDFGFETQEPVEYPVSEEVLADNEYARMTLVNAKRDEWGDYAFEIRCENKTEDTNLYFAIDNEVVNGWLVESYFSETVEPGSDLTSSLYMFSSDLEPAGIESPDRMELYIRIFDADSWDPDYIVDDVITVYPTGLSEADIVEPARPAKSSEYVVADNDDFTFIIVGEKDQEGSFSFGAGALQVYIKNKSDKKLYFEWDDVYVNGVEADPYFGCTLPAGQQTAYDMSFDVSNFEDNTFESYEKVEFTLKVRDDEDWESEDIMNETFVYEP